MDRIALEKLSDDGLAGVRWGFYLLGDQLLVDTYEEVARETKRQRMRVQRSWSRLNQRDSSIKQANVPFTPEIAQEAKALYLRELTARLTVGFQK